MYEAFFGLKQKPFALQPDSDFVFEGHGYIGALQALENGFAGYAELSVVTGDIGCGKTTLIHGFLNRLGEDVSVGLVAHTNPAFSSIAPWALISFDQKPTAGAPEEVRQQLMLYLIGEFAGGRRCLLIIDEAQNLTLPALEELHLLAALNAGEEPLLQVVLVGQPEMLDRLKDPTLAPLAERISVLHAMQNLSFAETGLYVRHRLAVAGADRPIFNDAAIAALHFFSEGTPRLINMLGDLALVYAFANDQAVVDLDLIQSVISDRRASGIAPFAHMDSFERAEMEIMAMLPGAEPPLETPVAELDDDLLLTEELPPLLPTPAAAEGIAESTVAVAAAPENETSPESAGLELTSPERDAWTAAPNDPIMVPHEGADDPALLFSNLLSAHRITTARDGLGRVPDPKKIARPPTKISLRRRFLPRDENNG